MSGLGMVWDLVGIGGDGGWRGWVSIVMSIEYGKKKIGVNVRGCWECIMNK